MVVFPRRSRLSHHHQVGCAFGGGPPTPAPARRIRCACSRSSSRLLCRCPASSFLLSADRISSRRSCRLHADVRGEQHLFDLLDGVGIDLLLAGEQRLPAGRGALAPPAPVVKAFAGAPRCRACARGQARSPALAWRRARRPAPRSPGATGHLRDRGRRSARWRAAARPGASTKAKAPPRGRLLLRRKGSLARPAGGFLRRRLLPGHAASRSASAGFFGGLLRASPWASSVREALRFRWRRLLRRRSRRSRHRPTEGRR